MPDADKILYPPRDGSLILSDLVDFHSKYNPSAVLYVSTTSETDDATVEITHLEFSRAVHTAAYTLRPVNSNIYPGQVVGLVAITDILIYQTVVMGLLQAGLVPFPISHRLSAEAIANLLERTGANHLITTPSSLEPLISQVCSLRTVKVIDLPQFAHVYPHFGCGLDCEAFERYPHQSRHVDDTMLYLHSSGSTGLPKPIRHTSLSISLLAGLRIYTELGAYEPPVRLGAMSLPPYHVLGLSAQVMIPMYTGRSVGLYPPVFSTGSASSPITPSPSNILKHIKLTHSTATLIPPTTLLSWSKESSSIDILKTLEWVGFGGGPLPRELGDRLWSMGVNIRGSYGATEVGTVGMTFSNLGADSSSAHLNGQIDSPWLYMGFDGCTKRLWLPRGDNTFELVFLKCPTHVPAVLNYGDNEGYSTSDIFTPHPTVPDAWSFVGRQDEVIVHSTGEKTVPVPFENVLHASPDVNGAVMFGYGKDQAGVLIELRDLTRGSAKNARDWIWPLVFKANATVANFSRVFTEMILFTHPDKPLPRVPKGSVARKAALELYKEEIEQLHNSTNSASKSCTSIRPPTLSEFRDIGFIQSWLQENINEIEINATVDPSKDMFEQGCDSLSAIFLASRVVAALTPLDGSLLKSIPQSVIYEYPTIEKLAQYLFSLFAHSPTPSPSPSSQISDFVSKYCSWPEHLEKESVLLTGSTGALGSNILAQLLANPRVERVWAVNRSQEKESLEKQRAAFIDQGLNTHLLETGKVTFLRGDLVKRSLGLDDNVFDELQRTTTVIIHNAWKLDFNLSLPSFEPLIVGTKNLLNFAQLRRSRMYFMSSVSAAQNWDKSNGPVPEAILTNSDVAIGGGYGASKYVSERIVADSGLGGGSFRIGQICGGTSTGAWSTTDWFPIIIKTSLTLGMLPDACGVVSWIQMDNVAMRIVDTVMNQDKRASSVVNIVHPTPVSWTSIVSAASDILLQLGVTLKPLPLRPFGEWYKALEEASKSSTALDGLPAVKMLAFYQSITLGSARTLSDDDESLGFPQFVTSGWDSGLEQLVVSDVRKWLMFWRSKGLF